MTNSKTIKTNRRLGRRLILVLALGVAAAFMAAPASGFAATTFGAKLNKTIQPSNSQPAQPCTMPAKSCTRIEMDAYNDAGHERAPKDGVIKKVKLIAGGPGHFKLQIAEAKPGKDKGRVVRNGPRIDYNGQPNGTASPTTWSPSLSTSLSIRASTWPSAPRRPACCDAAQVDRTSSCSPQRCRRVARSRR